MVEVSLTIGKLDASLALLLTNDHHLIEFPTILLPDGVVAGSVVKIKCDRDLTLEEKEFDDFKKTQEEILNTFGKVLPKTPVLKIRNVTQTSCVLEWEKLELATSSIKSLNLYKDGVRLGQIPNPLQNTTTKLSGLPIDTQFKFQLKLSTTAGVFRSNEVILKTHKMTDLSGITACLGEIDDPKIDRAMIEDSLQKMGAKPLQDKVLVDTTHFICTKPVGREWKKALDSNIPIVRPEWLKACEWERRIIGVRMFYLDADEGVLQQRDYWGNGEVTKPLPEEPAVAAEASDGAAEETAATENVKEDEAPAVAATATSPEPEIIPVEGASTVEEPAAAGVDETVPTAESAAPEEPAVIDVVAPETQVSEAEPVAAEVAESEETDRKLTAVVPEPEAAVPEPEPEPETISETTPAAVESIANGATESTPIESGSVAVPEKETIDESALDEIPLDASKDNLAASAPESNGTATLEGIIEPAPTATTESVEAVTDEQPAPVAEEEVTEENGAGEEEEEEGEEGTPEPAATEVAKTNGNKPKGKKNKKNKNKKK